ncbi:IS4 family transposase [Chromobacterium amazonense]|uniref:IS4 family transposase n=1 Tax=Chromobacterium amazonense TaxID=1382803 RepID=UPI00166FB5C0|nr:IS4 family transposase [Chromobacterium amazonense]
MLSHDKIDWSDILEPHWARTQERMRAESVVLCLQDTTELDFNGQAIEGLGPLSYEAQRGMYLHATLAISPQRVPLGVLDAWMWARGAKGEDGRRPPALKESVRWVEGYERVAEQAQALPGVRLVYVADREGDMLTLMARAATLGHPADWLLRSQHDRKLNAEGERLWTQVNQEAACGDIAFDLPARRGQKARQVRQSVRIKRVELPLAGGATLEVSAVVAREVDPPKGVKPLEWRLLANRKVMDLEAAAELIDWYRARWEIEIFFHTLKTGCQVESLQLSSMARLERALAMYLVVSWRIGLLMRLGRACPDGDAERLLTREEWQAAWILARKPVPKQVPSLRAALHMIARQGGFLGRKSDCEPGVKSLWLGLQQIASCVAGMRFQQSCG